MMQHLIVSLIFVVCVGLVMRRIRRLMSQAKKNVAKCDTCTETSCPLRELARSNMRGSDCKRKSKK